MLLSIVLLLAWVTVGFCATHTVEKRQWTRRSDVARCTSHLTRLGSRICSCKCGHPTEWHTSHRRLVTFDTLNAYRRPWYLLVAMYSLASFCNRPFFWSCREGSRIRRLDYAPRCVGFEITMTLLSSLRDRWGQSSSVAIFSLFWWLLCESPCQEGTVYRCALSL